VKDEVFLFDTTECTTGLFYIKTYNKIVQITDVVRINPLIAELIPMCHLLILLGDLTFIGKCIVSISNKMQRHTVYLYLETALYVSGGTPLTAHSNRFQLFHDSGR
jgi:hypothetical protein